MPGMNRVRVEGEAKEANSYQSLTSWMLEVSLHYLNDMRRDKSQEKWLVQGPRLQVAAPYLESRCFWAHLSALSFMPHYLQLVYMKGRRRDGRRGNGKKTEGVGKMERKRRLGARKMRFKTANKNKLLNKALSLHWTFDNYGLSAW